MLDFLKPAAAESSFKMPEMPEFKIPSMKVDVPEIKAPQMNLDIPEMKAPELSLPQFSMPSMPKLDMPKIALPEAPKLEVPSFGLPSFDAPKEPVFSTPASGDFEGTISEEAFLEPQEVRDERARAARAVYREADETAKVRNGRRCKTAPNIS